MTDTHGSTPGNGPVPPTQGDEHAQHAAPMGQQPYYQQQQQYYQQPQHPQHPAGGVTVEKKSHGGRTFLLAFCGAAVACAIGLGGFGIWQATAGGNDSGSSSSATQLGSQNSGSINATDAESDQTLAEAVAQKALPSVAAIDVYTNQSNAGGMYGFGAGNGSEAGTLTKSSLGSGVVLTADGYIITNNHVVDGAQSVSVQLSDGTSLDAKIIGTDEQTDLAVIKVTPTSDLTAAEFGDSDELEPGEYAYAIGSPGGVQFANTITGGRISAINRDLTVNDRVMTLIQTDASINNGNSGGALINKYGQVVGITSAKLSGNAFGSATVEGMGFAIPINTAKDIVDELIQNGYVSGRPSIGITGQNVESADGKVSGVQVYSIDSRAKAASEGLQVGDVITAVDGTPTPDMDKVNELKQDKKAGDKLTLSVYRISTGKTLNITITLTDSHDLEGDDPNAQTQQRQSSQSDNSQQNDGYGSYGFSSPFGSFGW